MRRPKLRDWPVIQQLRGEDPWGLGRAARSARTEEVHARTDDADRVVPSVCPFCAVGCAQRIHVKDEQVVHVDGDADSPISRGRLCARGSSTGELVTGPARERRVKYRRPHGTEWETLDLDTAMDMIADRVIATRRETWEDTDEQGRTLHRTMGIGSLGGAALDNEENYLIKKLFTALGVVQVENQARI
ncbi:dehydrogenase [Egibacter rhizosphaerae]|uniref:Dehydrogenase n=2 Tax=Egibacter rhizosphaerae TaxID=1670831 RepID=A0A411YB37_9ACTN|nr:dehydrogenase [Egibacter rhizosphaerae]